MMTEIRTMPLSKSKRDGLYLLGLGAAVFLLLGTVLQHSVRDANEDFRAVVYGSRCLLHHCDPYNEPELFHYYQGEFPEPFASYLRSHTLTLYVNLPATVLFVSPFAVLPFGMASALWSVLTASSLILAALLMWDLGSQYAPILSGALIALSLACAAIVLGNGNPSGIVVALSMVGLWCFLKDRFVIAGIFCLALSLSLKPHDPGLIWLYLLLAGGSLRKRALQTAALAVLLNLIGVLYVSSLAPRWFPELRSNLAVMSAQGGNNDPGPTGSTSRSRATEMIISLQSVLSHFRDEPLFYNTVTYLVCGLLILVWLVATVRSPASLPLSLVALAVIAPITLLISYHRAYDARLLMVTVPACAMLYAERKTTGKIALLVTVLGLVFTGELPYVTLKVLMDKLRTATSTFETVLAFFLDHSAPVALLLLAVFYTWIYVSRSGIRLGPAPSPRVPGKHSTELSQNYQA